MLLDVRPGINQHCFDYECKIAIALHSIMSCLKVFVFYQVVWVMSPNELWHSR